MPELTEADAQGIMGDGADDIDDDGDEIVVVESYPGVAEFPTDLESQLTRDPFMESEPDETHGDSMEMPPAATAADEEPNETPPQS